MHYICFRRCAGDRVIREYALRRLGLLLMLLVITAGPLSAKWPTKSVFEAGSEGYNVYRIPALIKAANGDLLAFCEAREGGDASEIDLVVKRSIDDGATWGPLRIVQESDDFRGFLGPNPPAITVGNPAPVVDRLHPTHAGRIFLLFTVENDHVFAIHSDDDGRSWSTRREITGDVKKPGWGWYATGPVHAIQIQRGPYRGRLVIPADHRLRPKAPTRLRLEIPSSAREREFFPPGKDGEAGDVGSIVDGAGRSQAEKRPLEARQNLQSEPSLDRGPLGAQAILSDDHGMSWRLGALDETYEDGLNANETTVVELADGSLYFNTRDQRGSAPGHRGEAWSSDGGESFMSGDPAWQQFRPAPAILDPPVVQCALLGVRDDLILFSGPDENGPSGKGRSDLRLRYSTDQAKTWQDGPLIHVGPAAYSDMALLTAQTLGILYEASPPGRPNAHDGIVFTRIGVSEVTTSGPSAIERGIGS